MSQNNNYHLSCSYFYPVCNMWYFCFISGNATILPKVYHELFSCVGQKGWHMLSFLLHSCDRLCKHSIVVDVVAAESDGRTDIWTLNKRWNWSGYLYKVASECELNSLTVRQLVSIGLTLYIYIYIAIASGNEKSHEKDTNRI